MIRNCGRQSFCRTRRNWIRAFCIANNSTTGNTTVTSTPPSDALIGKRQYATTGSSFFLPNKYKKSCLQENTIRSYSSTTTKWMSETSVEDGDEEVAPRDVMAFDVLIVGGGPAGLAAAIKIKQLCIEKNKDLSVCVIDKGSEIGAHILSGNVFDPKAMYELFPEQADRDADNYWTKELFETQGSVATPVHQDSFQILSDSTSSISIPHFLLPHQLHNDANYIISLSQLCRWLATKAEELGVEIYPGFAASDVIIDNETGAVRGIATRDVGIAKDGVTKKSTYERGVELHARQTLFAEGARGSCSEYLMKHYQLRSDPSIQPQTYGLGLKEVWQVPPEVFKAGYVQHTIGYPIQSSPLDHTYGGSFLYHQEPDLVLIGFVIGLDYKNPYINPYLEFQRWKTHPAVKKHLEGGSCISYGARVLNEGGYHSIPKLTFPGGALIGCSAGFLNAVKVKGSHTAMKSGMVAAEATVEALLQQSSDPVVETGEIPSDEKPIEIAQYETNLKNSWVYKELYEVRNSHAAFAKWGMGGGMLYTALTAFITKGREPWTIQPTKARDADATDLAEKYTPIQYSPPDNKLTFDLLTNLQRAGTYHTDDQPSHLRIKPELSTVPESISLQKYGGPEQRFCPAGVYEYVDATEEDKKETNTVPSKTTSKKLLINAQNCIHCKCCSIKMPEEYIDWTVPEGGGGPQYQVM